MGVISVSPMRETIFICGVNHRTMPVGLRERLAYGESEIVTALARLKQAAKNNRNGRVASSVDGMPVMLSTWSH